MRLTHPLGRKINVKVIITLLFFSSITLNTSFANKTYAVQNSDFLEKIVRKNYPGSTHNDKEQIMVAILRANPDAFRGGNIHFLKKVDSLVLPDDAVIALISQDEAARTIKEHYKFFLRKKTGNFPNIPLPKLADNQSSVAESSTSDSDNDKESGSNKESSSKDSTPSTNSNIELETTNNTGDTLEPETDQGSNLATQSKEDRISELERKKKEQDQILQQLDEKIENLEHTSPTNPSSESEAAESPVNITTDTYQEDPIAQETIEPKSNTAPPSRETEDTSNSSTNKVNTFIERFLQNKQNFAFLLLPLLGLIGLLFWRRKKQLSTTENNNAEAIQESPSLTAPSPTNDNTSETKTLASSGQSEDSAIKIDMARAYQDMGYSDAAKEILEEVLIEGNNEQKEMAKALLAVF